MAKIDNKRKFTVALDGKEVKFEVCRPTQAQKVIGDRVHSRAFKEAVDAGAILRVRVKHLLREQKIWNDEKEKQEQKLRQQLLEAEREIKRGGFKLSRGRVVALQLIDLRRQLRELTADEVALDTHTVEGQADDARFNYFVSACTYHGEGPDFGKPYFSSHEDYLQRENDPVAGVAAIQLMSLLYNIDPDAEKQLPENQFLIKYGFKDKDGYFINKEGKRTDKEGRLINDEGRYVNEQGEYVDTSGRRVDEDGASVEEFLGFLDEEGQPVGEPAAVVAE